MTEDGLRVGADGLTRCWWPGTDPDYIAYHDREWGFPVGDDRILFEKLSLEAFQSGLSWLTILRKRDNFRAAFAGFDPERVARFGAADAARLMADVGIVRHRGKIGATIHNAARALELIAAEGSLADYLWRFAPASEDRPPRLSYDALRGLAAPPASRALSRDLKRRGWKFVGPTTVYAFMQAAGIVNDHLEGCAFRQTAEAAHGSAPIARGAMVDGTPPAAGGGRVSRGRKA